MPNKSRDDRLRACGFEIVERSQWEPPRWRRRRTKAVYSEPDAWTIVLDLEERRRAAKASQGTQESVVTGDA